MYFVIVKIVCTTSGNLKVFLIEIGHLKIRKGTFRSKKNFRSNFKSSQFVRNRKT